MTSPLPGSVFQLSYIADKYPPVNQIRSSS